MDIKNIKNQYKTNEPLFTFYFPYLKKFCANDNASPPNPIIIYKIRKKHIGVKNYKNHISHKLLNIFLISIPLYVNTC
jgi:hypothetical protein